MLTLQSILITVINHHVSLSFQLANVKKERGQNHRTTFLLVTLNDKVDNFPNHNFTTNAEVVFTTNLNES